MQVRPRDSRMKIGMFLLLGLIALQIVVAMIYMGMIFASNACHVESCYPLRFLNKGLWPLHAVALPVNILLLGLSLHFAQRWPNRMLVWMVPYFTCFTLPLSIFSLVWAL